MELTTQQIQLPAHARRPKIKVRQPPRKTTNQKPTKPYPHPIKLLPAPRPAIVAAHTRAWPQQVIVVEEWWE